MFRSIAHANPRNVMQLSASVASHLREQIISGQLKAGEFLRIDTIAAEMGVSTTPVREGLLLLQSESFVRLLPRRGFVVNSFSRDDLRDIFWAQAIIGAELAARAAVRMTPDDLAELAALVAEQKAAFAAGDDSVIGLGHQFHRCINLAAQSPRLALLLGSLTKQLPNRFYASIEGQLEETVQYHPIITEAIRMKDAEAVRSLMYRHIMSGADHLIESLERSGTWAGEPPASDLPQGDAAPAQPEEPRPAKGVRGGRAVKAATAAKQAHVGAEPAPGAARTSQGRTSQDHAKQDRITQTGATSTPNKAKRAVRAR